jgi:hypothetical protein
MDDELAEAPTSSPAIIIAIEQLRAGDFIELNFS